MVAIIKQQAKEWCLAFHLIHKITASWWIANPMGAITSSERVQFKELKENTSGLMAFIDGLCKQKRNNKQAGIGGIIYNNIDSRIFSFYGPSHAKPAFEKSNGMPLVIWYSLLPTLPGRIMQLQFFRLYGASLQGFRNNYFEFSRGGHRH